MAKERNFTYTFTTRYNKDGMVESHNTEVNRKKGYGISCFTTEESARKALKNAIRFYSDSYEILDWELIDKRTGIIEKMA